MPKYRVETNAGTYEIEADREPTANDVESYLRQSKEAAPAAPADAAATEAPVAPLSTKPPETPQEVGNELKGSGWQAMSTLDRYNYLVRNFSTVFARQHIGIGSKIEGVAERAIPTAVGQSIGRAMEIPGAEKIGASAGAMIGEIIAQTREDGESYRPGAIVGAGVSGLVTGKPLAGATQREVMREGGKYATANLAGKAVETGIDEGRLPTIPESGEAAAGGMLGAQMAKALARPSFRGRRDAMYSLETKTLKDLQDEGVLVPPHRISGNAANSVKTAMAGAEIMDNAVARRNQFAWQKLAREDVGLSKEALPIKASDLEARRAVLAEPYEKIHDFQGEAATELKDRMAEISRKYNDPHDAAIALAEPKTKAALDRLEILAAADVDELKKQRDLAKSARKAFDKGDPEAYDAWKAYKANAENIENAIEKAAVEIGDPELVNRLKASRKQIAQTYTVEEALNPGSGFVEPIKLGRRLLNGDKLSGNLEKIAKFQLTFRREAVEASALSGADLAAMNASRNGNAVSVLGGAKAVMHGTIGRAARASLLSDFVQGNLTNPREVQNFSSALARYVSENAIQAESPEAP